MLDCYNYKRYRTKQRNMAPSFRCHMETISSGDITENDGQIRNNSENSNEHCMKS